MKIVMLRKNSVGLKGTYENAEHHAKPTIPIIDGIVNIVTEFENSISEWRQGSNIHLLKFHDGRSICFRPLRFEGTFGGTTWGVEVLLHVSRKEKITLMQITNQLELSMFALFLKSFTHLHKNEYGVGSGNE